MDENKNRSETSANGTGKDSEKDINLGALTQVHSEKEAKQTKEQETLVPNDNINEQTEKAIVNVTARNSEKGVDEVASNQGRNEEYRKQNGAQENSISDENIFEPKESNNIQSSPSDRCTDTPETDSIGNEEIPRKVHCNKTLRGEEKCQSESIADIRTDSGKDILPFASSQDHTEKDIKQNDGQTNSVHNNIIFEQRENNNGESSSSDLNTDEAERKIAGKEETLVKANGNLQGMDENKNRSETIANGTGEYFEKDINVGASSPDHSDKDIKISEEQENFVPDYNINEQRESNNMESRASHPSRNEGETHVSGKEETLRKTHNNVRGMVEQECSSEAIVNVTGRDSEKKVEECASNRGHNEKDKTSEMGHRRIQFVTKT
ncbi:myb-like protein D [Stegodyphus dumicola]|uniref:myb-like protein D n=1 Tax=Stegodyphus dumicola TaxID=202533 RepID=UPI0015ABE066|nr:myb-like protein D [Stegodyphus dumicola]